MWLILMSFLVGIGWILIIQFRIFFYHEHNFNYFVILRLEWKGAPSLCPKGIICFLCARRMVEKGWLSNVCYVLDARVDSPPHIVLL